MAQHFTSTDWQKINAEFNTSAAKYGLPARRSDSVIIGSFNIRKLGDIKKRTDESWQLFKNTLERFDLIAIQEVMENSEGLYHLKELLGEHYKIAISDSTGAAPGRRGNGELLAFLYNSNRIEQTEVASDLSFDRSYIYNTLFDNRENIAKSLNEHNKEIKEWEAKVIANKALNKRSPTKPTQSIPVFISFIRQPHCVSFRLKGAAGTEPYNFIAVNAHLLYGKNKIERELEFKALIEWLTLRSKKIRTSRHPNLILLGDCNLDFGPSDVMREDIDSLLKSLNKTYLKSKKAADANFPLLSEHPKHGYLKTSLRQTATYDQIGIFSTDKRLPKPADNKIAGNTAGDFDYGVFDIGNLISNALQGKDIDEVTAKERKIIYKRAEFDITDHLPIWYRQPLPK
ncbi:Endonuclease/Exonuclease/phosphatase family protein [Gammaproteobacteria bacterium MOLA455]|nr:Endonuclease/Exonuclease/phosphatase family protein [Gammaproteobacteria bacterium MOLA455]